MLWLHRNTRFNELYKCQISGELIGPGDYYYQDDEDGLIVKASVYRQLLDEKKKNEFDYSKLENAESQRDYAETLKQAEREFMTNTLFDRKIAAKGGY
jgi:regulator of RNase E activity RraA